MTKTFAPARWKVRVKWEPRDIWIGLYWTRPAEYVGTPPHLRSRSWYICIVPCLPIIVSRIEKLR